MIKVCTSQIRIYLSVQHNKVGETRAEGDHADDEHGHAYAIVRVVRWHGEYWDNNEAGEDYYHADNVRHGHQNENDITAEFNF